MDIEHTFNVPVPPERAFDVLQDVERIGPCMPGATIESVDGRAFTGRVKVKIGPIQVTYTGTASYAVIDQENLTATIDARGKEARGSGTADATVTARVTPSGDGAEVHVVTDLAITGRPAQFGRGVMEEVGQKLINRFAECLAATLGEDEPSQPVTAGTAGIDQTVITDESPSSSSVESAAGSITPMVEGEAIDLLGVAGGPVARRLGPVLGGIAVLIGLWWVLRRR